MMRRRAKICWLVVPTALAVLLGGFAGAQATDTQKARPYVPRKIVVSPQPVTRDEAQKIFEKVNASLVRVTSIPKIASFGNSGNRPVSRAEVIDQFQRIFDATKPGFTYTPRKIAFDSSILTVKPSASRSHLENLIAWGCVDRVGPLATASRDTLGVLEFGDAVGFLMARIAQLSHYPDPRFTPELQP